MKERPILMNAAMAAAAREGRKTQTRRIINPQPPSPCTTLHIHNRPTHCIWPNDEPDEDGIHQPCGIKCPYGRPGDRLWVRETYYQRGSWQMVPGVRTKTGRQKWRFVASSAEILFDAPSEFRKGMHNADPGTDAWHKRLGRYMPRSASRSTYEITDVRVERLQDITAHDALAEGVGQTEFWTPGEMEGRPFEEKWWDDYHFFENYPQIVFKRLWESINGLVSWSANPWVWVVVFKQIEQE